MSRSCNKKNRFIGGLLVIAGCLFLPHAVQAATTVYFDIEPSTIFEGDTFVVRLNISTPDTPINVMDGTILYDHNTLEIKEISTGGSLFALWPTPPVFSENGSLRFVGGVAGGFQGKGGEVLKIIFLAKDEGEVNLDFLDGFSVFLHDGQGTRVNPWLRPLSIGIAKRSAATAPKDAWQSLLEADKIPPEFVEAIIQRDPHLFENRYFVSFFAKDEDSGISYYEVKEGELDFIRVESPYLLRDQSLRHAVWVRAFDKAGNEVVITPEFIPGSEIPYRTYLAWSGLVILIILVVSICIFLRRRPGKTKRAPLKRRYRHEK